MEVSSELICLGFLVLNLTAVAKVILAVAKTIFYIFSSNLLGSNNDRDISTNHAKSKWIKVLLWVGEYNTY